MVEGHDISLMRNFKNIFILKQMNVFKKANSMTQEGSIREATLSILVLQ